MERIGSRDWEVLYFIDNLDEYLNLQAINKEGTDIDGEQMKTWFKDIYG